MIFGKKKDKDRPIRDIFPNAAVYKPFTRMEKLPGFPKEFGNILYLNI